MSRLDSFIRRLQAQRACLDHAVALVADLPGPVLELGLGNGRTYDHLRERLPGRRIIAFDRVNAANLRSLPPEGDLILGEISQTAGAFAGIDAALVHADIGSGYDDMDELNLRWLPHLTVDLLASGGIAASGVPLDHRELKALPLPEGIRPGRYFLYRKG